MPYIKKKDPHASLRRLIQGYERRYSIIGAALGTCEKTARNKMKDPSKLTVDELVRLSRHLHIPADEIRAAISFQ